VCKPNDSNKRVYLFAGDEVAVAAEKLLLYLDRVGFTLAAIADYL